MIVLNYGGGTNSTALMVECVRIGMEVDLVVFADTGSEMPHTLTYVDMFSDWLELRGYPRVTTVRWIRKQRSKIAEPGEFVALHDWCGRLKTLPSKSFGLSGCTSKWKQQVVDGYLKNHPDVQAVHDVGDQVVRLIGYDADEPGRADRMAKKNPDPDLWLWASPLVGWDMGRKECEEAILAAGLPLPGKSSCWMCPSSTKSDIDRLGEQYPHLLEAALKIERDAIEAGNVKSRGGLGGRLNWNDYISGRETGQLSFEMSCGCFDG